mgnify:FL=1
MPQKGITSIRTQSATLNFSKGGSTSLYVDQNSPRASDNNDGYNWERPFKTINGAIAYLEPWMDIWIKSGIYQENVVIDREKVTLHGLVQAGLDRVEISPSSGLPLDVQVGYCEIEGISLVSTNSDASHFTGPGHHIHDSYIEVNSDGTAQRTGILLNDCDSAILDHLHLNGQWNENVIGIRVDGTLNASVDGVIRDSYFENFGTIGVSGQGINLNNAQRWLITKNVFNSCYNGIFCMVMPNSMHSIVGNQFYSNSNFDICDMNTNPIASGIFISNNFYGYVDWFDDPDHDGIASVPIQCYHNYDYAPLAYPHYQGPSFSSRFFA